MIRTFAGRFALALVVVLACAACAGKKAGPMEMGIESFEAQDYEAATAHFETALAADPENPEGSYYLGRIALASGEVDEAITRLQKAVELDDANSEYHFQLGVAYAAKIQTVSFFEQGQIASRLKKEFERAVETDPTSVKARAALAQYYLQAPPIAGGSPAKAMEQVEAIKELDPREGHLFMAQVHSGKKEYDAAKKELEAALMLDPKDPDVFYQLGMLSQTQEDYAAAFESLEKALALDPSYTSAMYQIGRTAVFSGQNLERAIACLNLYLEHEPEPGQPTWAHAHWRLGMVYEKAGDIEMARKEYQAALALDPGLENAKEALERL